MHVVKIRDDQGVERIYSGKLLRRADGILTFLCNGEELNVPVNDLLEMVPVFEKPTSSVH